MKNATTEALAVRPEQSLSEWGGAAERGLQARQEREAIISKVLKAKTDFGVIPGTDKPTLLKAGAEKIADSLNLYPDYEAISRIEDWDKPLFAYSYRCHLRQRGTDSTIATGIGSCNSMEGRYRWRKAERVCPDCKKPTIIKGKDEYGGGWLCWAKKGGCGSKFGDADPRIAGQSVGKVANDDIFSLVNTIDKMAQKRSLVAASLNLGFSEQFTQDMEDRVETDEPPAYEEAPPYDEQTLTNEPPPKAASPKQPKSWRGKLVKHESKNDTKNTPPKWTLHTFTAEDGKKFGTFDTTIAEDLLSLDGKFIELTLESTAKGNAKITGYRSLTEPEEIFDER